MKIDPLDKLFADFVKLKAGGLCEFCGNPPKSKWGYQNHHGVVHRRYLNTRWEEDNCAAVCLGCHNHLGDFPNTNVEFFKKRIGTKRYEELEIIARTQRKMDKTRKDEIKLYLKAKIKEYET